MRNVIGVVASVAYIVGVLAFSSKMKCLTDPHPEG